MNNEITRGNFIKQTGLALTAFVVSPGAYLSQESKKQKFRSLSFDEISQYRIVIPDISSATERRAAEQFNFFIEKMTGNPLELINEERYRDGKSFFIGNTRRGEQLELDKNIKNNSSFLFFPKGDNLFIMGETDKGLLYGVYGLLELWGVKKLTSQANYFPKNPSFRIPDEPIYYNPVFEYRTTSYGDTSDADYTNWHHLSDRSIWGMFVHTWNKLVPPEIYGEAHPEYYAMRDGVRYPGTQLCLSNEDVYKIVVENLKKEIDKNPEATYWSVSQNDNDRYCQCDNCRKIDEEYGSVPSGSIINFTNKIAKAFPGVNISTLAYWYSRQAPKNISLEPNVNIMLCNIESTRQKPVFDTDPAFSKDLSDWGRLTNNIIIWDYNIQFTNLISPFPNLHTIKPNLDFYAKNNVKMLFMQAGGNSPFLEMAGLRAYLISKLMSDPGLDDSKVMNEFLDHYYGAGGRYIRQYIDAMRESLLSSGFELQIFGNPESARDSYLSEDMMKVYKDLFDKAENAVKDSPEDLVRVKYARMPLMYAEIEIGRNEVDTPRSFFVHDKDNIPGVREDMKKLVFNFVSLCKQAGLPRVRERSISPDDYQESYNRIYMKMAGNRFSKSFGKSINSVSLPIGGSTSAARLTDGIFGSFQSWRPPGPDVNWVCYKGTDADFVLDLGKTALINSVTMDFLNPQAQADWNLLILPQYVSYSFSDDGKRFDKEIKIHNDIDPNPITNPQITQIQVKTFRGTPREKLSARYIKVQAKSHIKMPAWHIRAGEEAELYTDQIVVV